MITPAFELSQDPEYLTLSVRVPYTRTSEFDLYLDGNDLKFFAKPYFLRLNLPGRIVEDGREKATFDTDKGVFTLRVAKETAGEHFEGLHLLTSLLAPKGSHSAKPLVEEVNCASSADAEGNDEEDEEEFDWQIEQQVYKETPVEQLAQMHTYGFGNQRAGVFTRLQEELADVIDVKNPEGTTAAERKRARVEAEASAFSTDHYLADLFEDDEIKGLLKHKPWWTKLKCSSDEGEAAITFTDEEKEQMRKFSNRSYLLDKATRHQVWLNLVDILLAYCYEVRSTDGEHNVESPWTIRKLSGTLCWLETYSSLQDVLISFGRRVLCFPLYRHFDMVSTAIRDTAKILQLGRGCVLKCLLDIHRIFRENDPAYILNDLYITDYCIWIQRVKSKKVTALASALQKTSLEKRHLALELEELEKAAMLVQEEENLAAVSPGNSSGDASSDSSESSESEESDCEGLDSANAHKEGRGGGLRQHSPPHPDSGSCTIPPESRNTPLTASKETGAQPAPVPALRSRPLIQELEELTITEETHSRSREQDAISDAKSGAGEKTGNTGNYLELSPRRNPLLIVRENSEEGDCQS